MEKIGHHGVLFLLFLDKLAVCFLQLNGPLLYFLIQFLVCLFYFEKQRFSLFEFLREYGIYNDHTEKILNHVVDRWHVAIIHEQGRLGKTIVYTIIIYV